MNQLPVARSQFKEISAYVGLFFFSEPTPDHWQLTTDHWKLTAAGVLLSGALAVAQTQSPSAAAGFHHLHLNSSDPAAAIDWYTKTFAVTSRANVAGFDGIATEKIHLLFSKTAKPPIATLDSPIWHFGWGSPDMPADFAMHQANGVRFATPLSKLAQGTVFAYMNGPDGALVEINSAQSRAFVHVHLYSEHPLCTGDWYVKHLGGVRRAQARVGAPGDARSEPCEVPYAAPSEPLAVVRQVLARFKNSAPLRHVKDALVPDAVAPTRWTAWWKEAKQKALLDPRFHVGAGRDPRIDYAETAEVDFAAQVDRTFAGCATVLERQKAARFVVVGIVTARHLLSLRSTRSRLAMS